MSNRSSARSFVWFIAILAAIILGGALELHFRRQHADAIAARSSDASMSNATLSSSSNWIAFHGGGRLLGDAGPIQAPPMKLRWRLRPEDDPAPATAPATAPSYHRAGHYEGAAAIVNGVAFVADTAGVVRAVDLASGKIKWIYRSEDGFETTPLVLDGRVLLGDLGGLFHAISAQNGQKLWTFDSGSEIHSSANYLGAQRSRIVFGNDGADIFCLDAETGKQIWDQKAGDRVNGAPAVANGSVLVSGCDAELRALKQSDGSEEYSADLGALCPGSAAVAGDDVVMGTDQGRVLCISAKTHQQLWLFDSVGEQAMVFSSPAISDGIVTFGARDRNVYGLDLSTGTQKWKFATRGEVDSSPVISAGRVYIASKDKKLYVLDLKTGKQIWSFIAGRGITAAPAIGDGVLVIGDSAGNLFCLE